jgi:hypothetical protein
MIFTNNLRMINFNVEAIYFIHVPKTAGSSMNSDKIINLCHGFNIEGSYRVPAYYGGYSGYLTDKWPKYNYPIENNLKITIIRNPFDLLCSYYHHGDLLRHDGKYCHSGWASVNYTHQFRSFKQFITAYCDEKIFWHQPLFKQFLFSQLFDENDNCVPDIIIRYEYFNEAVDCLNQYGLNIRKMRLNVSVNKKKHYTEYYDEDMIRMVEKKCSRELRLFRYTFFGTIDRNIFILNPSIKYSIKKDKLYFP